MISTSLTSAGLNAPSDVNAAGAATTWDYTYDGGGNRIGAKTTTGSVVSNLTTTYDSRGLPTASSDAVTGESITYAHDAVGNLTLTNSDENTNDWAQAFDAYGRMTCAEQATTCTSGTASVLFTFDALDRALTRDYNGTTTAYTYSGISEQLAQTVAGATTTTFASTPGGHPMAQKVGSAEASYHLLDTHSDVVGLVSSAAANQGTTSYDAYGGVLATTGTQGILGYQGDITDAATKQVDMGTRWYAPGQGRFTSRDVLFGELSSPMSLNQFAYAGGNPITMWDPTGMRPTCAPDCSREEEQDLTDWYSETVTSNGGYSTPYDPSPPQPQPAPAITYVRESGDYAQKAPGTLEVSSFEEIRDEDCGMLGWRCWDNTVINGVGRALSELPDLAFNLMAPGNGVDLVKGRNCGNGRVTAKCYENGPLGLLTGWAGYKGLTIGNTINCSGSCDSVINHELVHVAQYQEDGFGFMMRWAYERPSGYCGIGYEIEARELGGGECAG